MTQIIHKKKKLPITLEREIDLLSVYISQLEYVILANSINNIPDINFIANYA